MARRSGRGCRIATRTCGSPTSGGRSSRLACGLGRGATAADVADDAEAARAAALLGPANATRRGTVIWIHVSRVGGGAVAGSRRPAARAARRGADRGRARAGRVSRRRRRPGGSAAPTARRAVGRSMDAGCPTDWSDLSAEIELTSSDYLERGALLLAPVNPGAGRRAARLPLPRRAAIRLRRLGRDDATAASSGSTARGSTARSASCAPSPTRSPSPRRARSGTSADVRSDRGRAGLLVPDREAAGRSSDRRRGARQGRGGPRRLRVTTSSTG